jgi:hypothetical protein
MRRPAALLRVRERLGCSLGARAPRARPLARASSVASSAVVARAVAVLTEPATDALMMTATWDWDGVEILLDQASTLGLNGARCGALVASHRSDALSSTRAVTTMPRAPRRRAHSQPPRLLPLAVVRTWAFGERPANGNPKTPALQVAPGVYDEAMFAALDRVVFESGKRGLRLLLALSNNWDAYGGAPAYISWAAAAGEAIGTPTAPDASPFFTSPHCKAAFKAFMTTLLNRVNTYSGVAYKDDPVIFGFDLMNEPRVPADPSGATLGAWITEMAAHFKGIDRNHLLTIGAEGFYGQSTPELMKDNPPGDNGTGNDYVAHHTLDGIDFATAHCWPDQWLQCCTVECLLPFLDQWVQGHIAASTAIRRPFMVEEFGAKLRCFPHGQSSSVSGSPQTTRRLAARKPVGAAKPAASPPPALPPPALPSPPPAPPVPPAEPPTPPQLVLRSELYKLVYSRGNAAVAAGSAWGGSLFWLLGIDGVPDADHYVSHPEMARCGPFARADLRAMSMLSLRRRSTCSATSPWRSSSQSTSATCACARTR